MSEIQNFSKPPIYIKSSDSSDSSDFTIFTIFRFLVYEFNFNLLGRDFARSSGGGLVEGPPCSKIDFGTFWSELRNLAGLSDRNREVLSGLPRRRLAQTRKQVLAPEKYPGCRIAAVPGLYQSSVDCRACRCSAMRRCSSRSTSIVLARSSGSITSAHRA